MNVLLVDDHSLYREALEMLIMQISEVEEIYHAESGNEAIEAVKNHPEIALVLLDYNLDDGLGVDVLLRLRARYPDLRIAMLSADIQPDIILQCINSGADGYIFKRMKSHEINHAVEQILAGETFIPEGALDKEALLKAARKKVGVPGTSNVEQLAAVARHIVLEQDLSIRAHDVEETPGGMVSAFNSLLDQLHDNQKQLKEMAFCDELTGLYNRRYFLEQLENAYSRQVHKGLGFTLVYIDLDFFKQVNDTHGHHVGDELLREVAVRIKHVARDTDVTSRLGGDEFTMIVNGITSAPAAKTYLERLLGKLNEPLNINDISIKPSASIGAALSGQCPDIEQLMKLADTALYMVKNRGRNGVHVMAVGDGASALNGLTQ
ncbi:MAG: hypothetical protein COA42_08085 [Alteromonadaceae bacterium]|nr:MAG: hypothetical protein COA42_08085 [Alteromonadaceae bacterium]